MNRGMRSGVVASGGVVAAMLLSGCVSGQLAYRDPSIDMSRAEQASAVVDADNGTVILPLDAYFFTDAQVRDAAQLTAYRVADCLEEAGFVQEPTVYEQAEDGSQSVTSASFLLGFDTMLMWRQEQVPSHDELTPDPGAAVDDARIVMEGEARPRSDDAVAAEARCSPAEELETYLPFLNPAEEERLPGLALVQAGVRGAIEYVRSTSDYSELAAGFSRCLESAGVAVSADWTSDRLSPESFAAEVRCHTELGSIQQLADLAAAYQQAYVEKYSDEKAAAMAAKDALAASYAEQLTQREAENAE